MNLDDFLLILCCDGKVKNNLTHCPKTSNTLVNLSKLKNSEQVINYLDSVVNLFDNDESDYNKCFSTINTLGRTFDVFDLDKLSNIQQYLRMHKGCGIKLMLIIKES